MGLSCQDSWGWALGAGEGVSQCGPHSAQGARHKDSNSNTKKRERDRVRQEDDGEQR